MKVLPTSESDKKLLIISLIVAVVVDLPYIGDKLFNVDSGSTLIATFIGLLIRLLIATVIIMIVLRIVVWFVKRLGLAK